MLRTESHDVAFLHVKKGLHVAFVSFLIYTSTKIAFIEFFLKIAEMLRVKNEMRCLIK